MSVELVSVIIGAVLPIAVSFLKNQNWPTLVKFGFSIAVSAAAATVSLVVQNDWGFNELLANAAVVWSASQVTYQTWFKDTNAEVKLAETKTL